MLLDNRSIILVGHRGTGKTTLGPLLAKALGEAWTFIDLDAEITRVTGRSPAEIIAEDEANFRRVEAAELRRLLGSGAARTVIALGAGCPLPRRVALTINPLIIWLWRDGWQATARRERQRLRAELSFAQEVDWMRQTREPAWAAAAHLFFQIPRARAVGRSARMLADYAGWALEARHSAIAKRSWLVPESAAQLPRALEDAQALGCAGVEIRSDLLRDLQALAAPQGPAILASLRTSDLAWLEEIAARPGTDAVDIDLNVMHEVLGNDALARIAPRTLLLSTHPVGVGQHAAKDLLMQAARIRADYPQWAPYIQLKYAPSPTSFAELRRCFRAARTLQRAGHPTTFLPQGARFAWTRPILANPRNRLGQVNAANYLPVGVRKTRLPAPNTGAAPAPDAAPSPMDLQDWLPHFARIDPAQAPAAAEDFDALIGDPVHASVGDWWHTRAAIADAEPTRYLKIPLGRDDDDAALDQAFALFAEVGLRGLSVTAPLKQRMQRITGGQGRTDAPLNTLRRVENGWLGRDTDALGMLANLRAIDRHDAQANSPAKPERTVSIIGRGGVSPAIRRAIDAAGWTLVEHASAREGWKLALTDARAKRVRLVVNAAGSRADVAKNAPQCEIWLDLHYSEVGPKPARAQTHQNGDLFFEAQAQAQREFWRAHPR